MLPPDPVRRRDRDEFLWLLGQLRDRLSAAGQDPPELPSIRGIITRIDYLELGRRTGFDCTPITFGEREDGDRLVATYEPRDPLDRRVFRRIHRTNGEPFDPYTIGRREVVARLELLPYVKSWISAVSTSPEDRATPIPVGGNKDGRSFPDWLWFTLNDSIRNLEEGQLPLQVGWAEPDEFVAMMHRINALAVYDGLTHRDIFLGVPLGLVVGQPEHCLVRSALGEGLSEIVFQAGSPPDEENRSLLVAALQGWKGLREKQLAEKTCARPRDDLAKDSKGEASPEDGSLARDLPAVESSAMTLYEELEPLVDTASFNALKPTWRRAVAGYVLACRESPRLPRDIVALGHHKWVLGNRADLLLGRARTNPNTWVTYARQGAGALLGTRRHRKHVPTRSVVSPAEADFGRRRDG